MYRVSGTRLISHSPKKHLHAETDQVFEDQWLSATSVLLYLAQKLHKPP